MNNNKLDRLWNANYIKVMATNFALFFAFYLLAPLLPLYLAEHFHATKDVIGFVLSGYTVVSLLARPFSGFMVDSFPRKRVLMIALTAYFILFGGYLVAGNLVLFALLRTIHGGPFGASTVANSTVAIDVLPSSRRNEGIGFYGLSNNLASAIAPSIGLFVYHYTGSFELLFWIAFIVAAVAVGLSSLVHLPKREITKDTRPISFDRFFMLRGWFLAVNILFMGFCWGVISNYLAIYGKEHLGITSGTGIYFAILSAGLILSRLWGSKSLRKGRLKENALIGVLLSTAGYIIFIAWSGPVGYYASAVLIGLGNGHIWPAFSNMIIRMARHNERGTANSTILTSWDLGLGIGVLLGGVVAEHAGYDSTFWMMAGVHILCLVFYLAVVQKQYTRAIARMEQAEA